MRESDAADTGTVSMKSAATASPRGPGRTVVDVNPIISIVIPALNEEKLIEQTLRVFSPELRARHGVELIV
ncbi:MAG: hypothetical protein ABI876_12565, partial [Bacteroidota bacterium]